MYLVLFIPIHLTILEVLQSMMLAPTIFLRLLYIRLRNHPCPSFFLHHHPLYIPPLPLTPCTLLQYLNRSVPNVSNALRSEFARGDGRIKRKEDDRRRKIQPSETLFVVNFHEETTKREDLQMLFEPFGELVRIDMKRNYAFVQFRTIEEATRAKEVTNGGKLDQSVLTVEYVARQRSGDGGGGGGNDGRRSRDRDRHRGGVGNDRGGGYDRRGPPPQAPDRYRRDDYRRRSPPRHRRSSRSRSRSPPRYRSRSPPRRRSRSPSPGYYRRDRDYRGGDRLPPPRGGPDDGEYFRRDDYRGDRGYR